MYVVFSEIRFKNRLSRPIPEETLVHLKEVPSAERLLWTGFPPLLIGGVTRVCGEPFLVSETKFSIGTEN